MRDNLNFKHFIHYNFFNYKKTLSQFVFQCLDVMVPYSLPLCAKRLHRFYDLKLGEYSNYTIYFMNLFHSCLITFLFLFFWQGRNMVYDVNIFLGLLFQWPYEVHAEQIKRSFAKQRAKDLAEHAKMMMLKDKEVEGLRHQYKELAEELAYNLPSNNEVVRIYLSCRAISHMTCYMAR